MPIWSRQALRIRLRDIAWQRLAAMLLAIAALCVGIAAWSLAIEAARTEPVVLAAGPIAPGERIRPELLSVVQVPLHRPIALTGVADPALLIGRYARVQITTNQLMTPDLVQAQPLAQHNFSNGELPAETLQAIVYELPRTGLASLTSQDRVNILALVDEGHGRDPEFRVGAFDTPGAGGRVVRVLRSLNVLAVNERTAFLELTAAQSAYLWALQTASVPLAGELAATPDAPLGPVRAADRSLAELGMEQPGPPTEEPQP